MARDVLLLSGGVDSLVMLSSLDRSSLSLCLSFDYGQRHKRELQSARDIAKHYKIDHVIVQLPLLHGSALTDGATVPVDVSPVDQSQSVVVVPNRNMIMVSVAANYAGEGGSVFIATNKNDHTVFPDCRPAFLDALTESLRLALNVRLAIPFCELSKDVIVRMGRCRNVPFHLAWSCYLGGEVQCGRCAACVGVNEAMADRTSVTGFLSVWTRPVFATIDYTHYMNRKGWALSDRDAAQILSSNPSSVLPRTDKTWEVVK